VILAFLLVLLGYAIAITLKKKSSPSQPPNDDPATPIRTFQDKSVPSGTFQEYYDIIRSDVARRKKKAKRCANCGRKKTGLVLSFKKHTSGTKNRISMKGHNFQIYTNHLTDWVWLCKRCRKDPVGALVRSRFEYYPYRFILGCTLNDFIKSRFNAGMSRGQIGIELEHYGIEYNGKMKRRVAYCSEWM
jgi:hypothetical protein